MNYNKKRAVFSCRSQLEALFLIAVPLKKKKMMMMTAKKAKRKKKAMKRVNLRMILNLKASVMKILVQ